jgi:hypothetical protein
VVASELSCFFVFVLRFETARPVMRIAAVLTLMIVVRKIGY